MTAVRGGAAGVEEVVLGDGTRVAGDHVVVAIGVRPAAAWFAGAALDARVFLAGDVTGGGHWDAAARQGAGAARALLGLPPAPRRRPRSGATSSACACTASGDPAGARAELTADAGGRGFEADYRRGGRSAPSCSPAAPPPTCAPPAGASTPTPEPVRSAA